MIDREQFLIELEKKFDRQSWDEIINLVVAAIETKVQDDFVDAIVLYVKENNRISFKQWKVLHHFVYRNSKSNIKYKYGKQ